MKFKIATPYHYDSTLKDSSPCLGSTLQSWMQKGGCLARKTGPILSSGQRKLSETNIKMKELRSCTYEPIKPLIEIQFPFIHTTIGRCRYAIAFGRQAETNSGWQFNIQSTLGTFVPALRNTNWKDEKCRRE